MMSRILRRSPRARQRVPLGRLWVLSLAVVLSGVLVTGQVHAEASGPFSSARKEKSQRDALVKRKRLKKQAQPRFDVLYTPWAWWRTLVRGEQAGVLLRYGQWQALWRSLLQARDKAPPASALRLSALQSCQIDGRVSGQQLLLSMRLVVRTQKPGWQALPLPFEGLGIASVKMPGLQATLRSVGRRSVLFVHGPAEGTVSIEGGVRIRQTSRGKRIAFSLPPSLVSRLRLVLPAQQDPWTSIPSLRWKRERDKTVIWGGVGGHRALVVRYRPLTQGTRQKTIVEALVRSHYHLRPGLQRLDASVVVQTRMGTREQFTIQLPAGFRLVDIQAPTLADFVLSARQRRLQVRLRQASKQGRTAFRLRLIRQGPMPLASLQQPRVVGAYAHSGQMLITFDRRLRYRLQAVAQASRQPLPSTFTPFVRGRALHFWVWNADATVKLAVFAAQTRFQIHQDLFVSLQERQARLSVQAAVSVQRGKLYQLSWEAPAGWELYEVRDNENKELRHWRHGKRWFLELAKPLKRGQKSVVRVDFVRALALPKVGQLAFTLPTVHFVGGTRHEGKLHLAYPLFYEGLPQKLRHLQQLRTQSPSFPIELPERYRTLSFGLVRAMYAGEVVLSRRKPSVQLLSVGRYAYSQGALVGEIDAHLRVSGAGIDRLTLRLSHGANLSIQFVSDKARIIGRKRSISEDGTVTWRLSFAKEHFGVFALTLRFKRRLKEAAKVLEIPMLSAPESTLERGFVAVATTSHTRLSALPGKLFAVDPLALPASKQRNAPYAAHYARPLFAYRYNDPARVLQLVLKHHSAHPLDPAIVRELSLKGSLDSQGSLQMAASFVFVSRSHSLFEATLPKGSELWSATLNGRGIKPMRRGLVVQVPLSPSPVRKVSRIRLTYARKNAAMPDQRGALHAYAPAVSYPVQRSSWSIGLPYELQPTAAVSPFPVSGVLQPKAFATLLYKGFAKRPFASFMLCLALLLLLYRRAVFRLILAVVRGLWALLVALMAGRRRWAAGLLVFLLFIVLPLFPVFMFFSVKESPPGDFLRQSNRFAQLIIRPGSVEKRKRRKLDDGGGAKARGKEGRMGRRYASKPSVASGDTAAASPSPAASAPPPPPMRRAVPSFRRNRRARRTRRRYRHRRRAGRRVKRPSGTRPLFLDENDKKKAEKAKPKPKVIKPTGLFGAKRDPADTSKSKANKDAKSSGWLGAKVGDSKGSGGLGLRGGGAGGGGLAGTSRGLGRIGTYGRGGGKGGRGWGRGRMRGKRRRATEMGIGRSVVYGALDKRIIRRVVRQHRAQIKYCYERELVKNPRLAGKVKLFFQIGANGRVSTSRISQTTVNNDRIEQCIARRVRYWRFPQPKGGGVVHVVMPFYLGRSAPSGSPASPKDASSPDKARLASRLKQSAEQLRQRRLELALKQRVAMGDIDTRLMRGIRSLQVQTAARGWWLRTQGLGQMREISIFVWQASWLRTVLLGFFVLSLFLCLAIGRVIHDKRRMFFFLALFLSVSLALLLEGVGILLANTFTIALVAAGGISLFKPRQAATGSLVLLLLLGAASLSRAAPPAPQAGAKAEIAQDVDASQPCLPFDAARYEDLLSGSLHARVYVPYRPAQGIPKLSGQTQVFVPQQWWQLLQLAAGKRCARAPAQAAWWLQASYSLQVTSGGLEGKARFFVTIRKAGWHKIPLGLKLTRLRSASADGKPLSLGYGKGGYRALLQGPGVHRLEVRFSLPLKPNARAFSLSLAPRAVMTMQLSLPQGPWQVQLPQAKGGFQQVHTKKKGTQVRAILGRASRLQVRWKPALRQGQAEQQSVDISSAMHVLIKEQSLRCKARFQSSSSFKKHDRLTFRVPPGILFERLTSPHLRSWFLSTHKGKKHLTVLFDKPQRQQTVVIQHAQRFAGIASKRRLALLRPVGVSRHIGFLGLRASKALHWTALENPALEKRNASEYDDATQKWGGTVQESYAFQRSPALQLVVRPRAFRPHVSLQHRVQLDKKRLLMRSFVFYPKSSVPVFSVSFRLSKGLRLRSISAYRGAKVQQAWIVRGTKAQPDILHVELRKPLQPKQGLLITTTRSIAGALVSLPVLIPRRVHRLRGELAISAPSDVELEASGLRALDDLPLGELRDLEEDYKVPTEVFENLASFNASLSYSFQRAYQGRLRRSPKTSTLRCKGFVSAHVEDDSVSMQVRLAFRASGPGQRAFSFSLPASVASRVEFPPQGSDSRSQRARDGRVFYTIRSTALRSQKRVRFRLRLSLPASGEARIPAIQPEGAPSWHLDVVLSKQSHLRLFVDSKAQEGMTQLLPSELARIPSSLRKKGIVVGVRVRKAGWRLAFRRELLKTQVSIRPLVESALLETTISNHSEAWTRVTYSLRTPGMQFLRISLPEHATLWEARIGTKQLPIARQGKSFLIPLPPRQSSDLAYRIQLLYAHPLSLPRIFGQVSFPAPALHEIHVAQTFWTVFFPRSMRVLYASGNMDEAPQTRLLLHLLERAFAFYQKLYKLSQTSKRSERRRAWRNLSNQWKRVWRLHRKLGRQVAYSSGQMKAESRQKFVRLRAAVSAMRRRHIQQSKRLSRSLQRASWRKHFGIQRAAWQARKAQTYKARGAQLELLKHASSRSYSSAGGDPALQISFYRAKIAPRVLGWLAWSVLLLLFLLWGRRRRRSTP